MSYLSLFIEKFLFGIGSKLAFRQRCCDEIIGPRY
jgi:hypothetical protein